MSFVVVVPARFASTRLPGKPLADIGGKPMVVRVADAALRSGAREVWVATDDERVRGAVESAGHRARLTRGDHVSGTDRIAEVATALEWADDDIVVNVQGDEPLIDPALIADVARALEQDAGAAIATAAHAIADDQDFLAPGVVKVVTDAKGRALYFSRAPIPWPRDAFAGGSRQRPADEGFVALRHVGVYAYRVAFLKAFGRLPPSPLERWESLEQLRALWHGYPIRVVDCAAAPLPGVDTPEDLERARREFRRRFDPPRD